MTDFTREEIETASKVFEHIALMAEGFGQEAGVGAMELAGALVSYLATHPRDVEPLLRFGITELPLDWHERGCLTWRALNGKLVHPDYARRARTIKKLAKRAAA